METFYGTCVFDMILLGLNVRFSFFFYFSKERERKRENERKKETCNWPLPLLGCCCTYLFRNVRLWIALVHAEYICIYIEKVEYMILVVKSRALYHSYFGKLQ